MMVDGEAFGVVSTPLDDHMTGLRSFFMAYTRSSKKMVRKIATRTAVNTARRSRMRTFIRRVEEAIMAGDKEAAQTALRDAQPEIMRAAGKGLIHKNTSARKVSRLSKRIKALG